MTWAQSLRRIILPQAARIAVPPLSNTFISLVKDTSLASVITVPEMFLAAQQIRAVTDEPLILYSEAAIIYLFFSSVLSHLQVMPDSTSFSYVLLRLKPRLAVPSSAPHHIQKLTERVDELESELKLLSTSRSDIG